MELILIRPGRPITMTQDEGAAAPSEGRRA
jgi:hypothetical protein